MLFAGSQTVSFSYQMVRIDVIFGQYVVRPCEIFDELSVELPLWHRHHYSNPIRQPYLKLTILSVISQYRTV